MLLRHLVKCKKCKIVMRRHQSQVKYEVNIKLSFVYKWQSELRKTNYEREMIACIDVIMITLKYTLSVIKACNLIYVTNLASLLTKPLTYRVRHSHVLRLLLWKLDNVSYSIPPIVLTMHKVCSFAVKIVNKKAVLPQGNRTMLQVFFSVEVRQHSQHSLQV